MGESCVAFETLEAFILCPRSNHPEHVEIDNCLEEILFHVARSLRVRHQVLESEHGGHHKLGGRKKKRPKLPRMVKPGIPPVYASKSRGFSELLPVFFQIL